MRHLQSGRLMGSAGKERRVKIQPPAPMRWNHEAFRTIRIQYKTISSKFQLERWSPIPPCFPACVQTYCLPLFLILQGHIVGSRKQTGRKGWKRRCQIQPELGYKRRSWQRGKRGMDRIREMWGKGGKLCPLVCDSTNMLNTLSDVCHLEQLHQSLQLHHQLPPALLQRRHPLLQFIFPLPETHTPLLTH